MRYETQHAPGEERQRMPSAKAVSTTHVTGPASARRTTGAVARVAARVRLFLVTYWVPLVVFAASRLVDTVFLVMAAHDQVALTRTRIDYYVYDAEPADPGYFGIVSNWDAQWYRRIATDGYELPAPGGSAADTRNTLWTWAFPPAYPMIVRALMGVTTLSFPVAATIVSCLAGAAAAVLIYRLVVRTGGRYLATITVLFSSFFISAPLLQIGYSESLALLFLMAALNLLVDRRYWWAAVAVLALSFTRIVTLPLLLAVAVHAYLRWRAEGAFWAGRLKEALGLFTVAFVSVFGLVSWMLLASVFIGTKAGMERSAGQRSLYLGWFEDSFHLFGVLGPVFLLLFLALVTLNMVGRRGRVWAPELRAWSVAYPAFLFAMTPILPAVLRYLLLVPTLPVLLAGTPRTASKRSIIWVGLLLVALLIGQWWYAHNIVVVFTSEARPAP
ncbi:hypothetical protein [Intrasporangium flavum]|uniref:hypothetical protein n=1 Tax=Intrasporangium flavum TaxID=1428657 RepID=UPI001A960652|nr:hypothetical protein [Intrasporangium flavum]